MLQAILRVGEAIRQGTLTVEGATVKMQELCVQHPHTEEVDLYLQGVEEELRHLLRTCLDADASGEAQEAGQSALRIVECREELAKLLLVLRCRPSFSPEANHAFGLLEQSTISIMGWFDKQAASVELPSRMPRLLDGITVPEPLVQLASRFPDRWWLAPLLVPPPRMIPENWWR